MTVDEKRKELAKWILESKDETILNRVEEVRATYQTSFDEEVVAVTVQGKSLTRAQYIQEIDDRVTMVQAGHYTTQEDLEKEMLDW